MRTAEAREVVSRILPQLATPVQFKPEEFKHLRRRAADSMQPSCYYGGHYFDPHTAVAGSPEMNLCQSAITGTIRHGNDCFTIWFCYLGELEEIVRRPANGSVVDWSYYDFVKLDDETKVMVFPTNRFRFGHEVAAVVGNDTLWSCYNLKKGLDRGR